MRAAFCTPPAPDPNKRIPSKFSSRLFLAVAYFLFDIFFSLQNCLRALLKVAVAAVGAKVGKLGLFGRWTRFSHLSIAARSRVLRLSDGKVFT